MKPPSYNHHTRSQCNGQQCQAARPYLEPLPAVQLARHLLGGGHRHRVTLCDVYAVIKNTVAPSGMPAVGGDVHRVALSKFAYVYAVVYVDAVYP